MEPSPDRVRRIRRGVDAVLLGLFLLAAWTINAELFHWGGMHLAATGETRLDVVPTLADLGADDWQIGAIMHKDDQGIYQVNIVDAQSQELFKLTVDAHTGELTEKGRAKSSRVPLPADEIQRRVAALLPHLTIGPITQKQGKLFAHAPLLYQGQAVARIKVDPSTGRLFDPSSVAETARAGTKKNKWVPGGLVMPLGWAGAALAALAVLYYSWRRSVLMQVQIAEEGKAGAAALLERTLARHCWMSFTALALILAHAFHQWRGIPWSVSWLTFALIITVSASGLVGKYLMHHDVVRVAWRRFHLPVVGLLSAVLIMHILAKLGIFSI